MVGFIKSSMSEKLKREGISKNQSDSDFDKEELRIGMLIETEHTDDKDAAKEIAKDHLIEDKNYYKNSLFKKERQEALKKSKDEIQDIQDDEDSENTDIDEEDDNELTIYEECAIQIMLDKKVPKTYPSVLQEM